MAIIILGSLPQMVAAGIWRPFVDVLAWKAMESNTAWAEKVTFPPGSKNVVNSLNTYPTRPGVKAGISYLSDDDFWDSSFFLTSYKTDNTNVVPVGVEVLLPLFFSSNFFFTGDVFFGASSHWQLAMNMLDLQVSRRFKTSDSIILAPRIGLKGGSIDQEVNANWNAILYQATENVTSDYTGIGPLLGLDAKWSFYPNFNFVGDVSGALLYGKWNMKDTFHRPASLVTTKTTISTSLNQAQLGTLMMDYYFGLEWVHKGISTITVNLGYEMQYWSNQLRMIAVQQLPAEGDLTLQGATCGISIDL